MTNNGKDGFWEAVFNLVDDRGKIIFTGSKQEIMDFMECTPSQFDKAYREKYRLFRLYYIKKIGMREVKEMMCAVCGKVLPVEKMMWRSRKDGSKVPVTECRKCHHRRNKEHDYRRREKKRKEKENADFN